MTATYYYVGQLSIKPLFTFDGVPAGWGVNNGGPAAIPFASQIFPTAQAAADYARGFEAGRKPTPAHWQGPRWAFDQ